MGQFTYADSRRELEHFETSSLDTVAAAEVTGLAHTARALLLQKGAASASGHATVRHVGFESRVHYRSSPASTAISSSGSSDLDTPLRYRGTHSGPSHSPSPSEDSSSSSVSVSIQESRGQSRQSRQSHQSHHHLRDHSDSAAHLELAAVRYDPRGAVRYDPREMDRRLGLDDASDSASLTSILYNRYAYDGSPFEMAEPSGAPRCALCAGELLCPLCWPAALQRRWCRVYDVWCRVLVVVGVSGCGLCWLV